jgi:hypothetical protein
MNQQRKKKGTIKISLGLQLNVLVISYPYLRLNSFIQTNNSSQYKELCTIKYKLKRNKNNTSVNINSMSFLEMIAHQKKEIK